MSKNITINRLAVDISKHLEHSLLKDFHLDNYNIIDYEKYIHFVNKTYNRNTVFSNDSFEIILISWSAGAITNIHNHPKNGCLLTILQGQLIEDLHLVNNTIKTNILITKSDSYLDDSIGTHIIYSPVNTVSLHIYSPPGFYN
jgi:hypothetical protein